MKIYCLVDSNVRQDASVSQESHDTTRRTNYSHSAQQTDSTYHATVSVVPNVTNFTNNRRNSILFSFVFSSFYIQTVEYWSYFFWFLQQFDLSGTIIRQTLFFGCYGFYSSSRIHRVTLLRYVSRNSTIHARGQLERENSSLGETAGGILFIRIPGRLSPVSRASKTEPPANFRFRIQFFFADMPRSWLMYCLRCMLAESERYILYLLSSERLTKKTVTMFDFHFSSSRSDTIFLSDVYSSNYVINHYMSKLCGERRRIAMKQSNLLLK